jgi:D-alanyl-D-alanine endopeptidase (penicillin-binding protein 7)
MKLIAAALLFAAAVTTPFIANDAFAAPAFPPAADNLQLASVGAVVLDLDSGNTLFRKHADIPMSIASVTKVMTAMVVLDGRQPLDEWVTIVDWHKDMKKNAYSRLRIGSQAQRRELLRIALMSSENLATNVLASHYPGGTAAFVAAMNDKARTLGMSHSRFVDPAGLSPNNQASADDLSRMLAAAYGYPEIREFSIGYQHTVTFREPRYSLPYGNTNPLVASSRWDLELTKTGYLTEAGRCLVMVTGIDDRQVGLVLLNSFGTRTPLGDAGRVRRWLTTGVSGSVAGAAREYEQRQTAALQQASSAVGVAASQ